MNEEDIKLVEGLIKEFKTYNDLDGIQDLSPYMKAIENLINRNKELEEKNKHLSSTSDYETICLECNNLEEQLEIANDKIKELEIEISRIPYFNKCWDTIYEMAVKNFESKIIAKIEELDKEEQELQDSISEEEREEYSDANISWSLCDIETRRRCYKELLQEGE